MCAHNFNNTENARAHNVILSRIRVTIVAVEKH